MHHLQTTKRRRVCLSWHLVLSTLLPSTLAIQPGSALAASPVRDRFDHPVPVSMPSGTGVIVPLYIYPGADWDRLVQAKNNHTQVPMVAVINPNSGPGSYQDANYVRGIQNLRSAGVIVLGYVYTSYASRSIDAVVAEVNAYRNWYDLDGFFFDEMSNLAGNEHYYSHLDDYAKSLGFRFTVGNPAADTLPSYIGTVDNLVLYEDSGFPSLSSLGGWHADYPKENFAMIAHSVSTLDPSFVTSASNYVGYIYSTNDVLPNPYDALPRYFEQFVSALDKSPVPKVELLLTPILAVIPVQSLAHLIAALRGV